MQLFTCRVMTPNPIQNGILQIPSLIYFNCLLIPVQIKMWIRNIYFLIKIIKIQCFQNLIDKESMLSSDTIHTVHRIYGLLLYSKVKSDELWMIRN